MRWSATLAAVALVGVVTPAAAWECASYREVDLNLLIDYSTSMRGWKHGMARDFALRVIDELDATGQLQRAGERPDRDEAREAALPVPADLERAVRTSGESVGRDHESASPTRFRRQARQGPTRAGGALLTRAALEETLTWRVAGAASRQTAPPRRDSRPV